MVRRMRLVISRPGLVDGADGVDAEVLAGTVTREVAVAVGRWSLFHGGCDPLVTDVLLPLPPLVRLPFPYDGVEAVGSGVIPADVLLASIVGVLVTCQLGAPS